MRFYRSQYGFRQYRPYKSFWQRWRESAKRKKTAAYSDGFAAWKNPYRREEKSRRPSFLLPVGLAILLIGWAGILIYLPYFRITEVSYSGLKVVKESEISADVNDTFLFKPTRLFPPNSYFLTREGKIADYLKEKYHLSMIEVKKVFPRQLRVNLEEKISTVIYDNGQGYYLLDQDGEIIKYLAAVGEDEFIVKNLPAPPSPVITSTAAAAISVETRRRFVSTTTPTAASTTPATTTIRIHIPNFKKMKDEFGGYPLIYDARGATNTEPGSMVLPLFFVHSIIECYSQTEKRGIGRVAYFALENPLAGVEARLAAGWSFFFRPENEITAQMDNLKIILRDNHPREYVDLRYGERVYWK